MLQRLVILESPGAYLIEAQGPAATVQGARGRAQGVARVATHGAARLLLLGLGAWTSARGVRPCARLHEPTKAQPSGATDGNHWSGAGAGVWPVAARGGHAWEAGSWRGRGAGAGPTAGCVCVCVQSRLCTMEVCQVPMI